MLLDSIGRRGLISGQEIDLTAGHALEAAYAKTTPLFASCLRCRTGWLQGAATRSQRRDRLRWTATVGHFRPWMTCWMTVSGTIGRGLRPIIASFGWTLCSASDDRAEALRAFVDWLRQSQPAYLGNDLGKSLEMTAGSPQ